MRTTLLRGIGCLLMGFLFIPSAHAQNDQPAPAKQPTISVMGRLKEARTVFLRDGGGNPIAFNVITSSFEGWGRYKLVNKPEEADLIVEISGPSQGGSSVAISSSTGATGKEESKATTTKEFSNGPVKMVVFDGKSKAALWSGMERPKSAMRKRNQEDNLVEAAETVFTRFHDRIEPPPAPDK